MPRKRDELLRQRRSVPIGQSDIHERRVGVQLVGGGESRRDRAGLARHRETHVTDDPARQASEGRVVVHEEHRAAHGLIVATGRRRQGWANRTIESGQAVWRADAAAGRVSCMATSPSV